MRRVFISGLAVLAIVCSIQFLAGRATLGQTPDHDRAAHATSIAVAQDSFFGNLFKVYMPRRLCMFDEQPLIGLHLVSDVLIAAAYYSIPIGLVYFVRRR